MSRRALRPLVVTCAVIALVGSAMSTRAQAFPYLGISQAYMDFGVNNTNAVRHDVTAYKSWHRLRIRTLRVVIPWDVGHRASTNDRREEFQHWLERIRQLEIGNPQTSRDNTNIEPFVVLGPTEIHPSQGVSTRTSSNGTDGNPDPIVPPASTYKAAVHKFLEVWGPGGDEPAAGRTAPVRIVGAWNEPNLVDVDMSIPNGVDGLIRLPSTSHAMSDSSCPSSPTTTNCGPLMAATYWKNARDEMNAVCSNCSVVAGEFSSAWGSSDSHARPYWNAYANHIDSLIASNYPRQISFHGHHDVEALDGSGDCRSGAPVGNCLTYRFANWLANRSSAPWNNRSSMKIWNTEVHAEFASGTSPSSPGVAQLNRIKHLVSISDVYQVKRIYYYNYQNQTGTDRGLVAPFDQGSGTRPAWRFFKKRLVRCRRSWRNCKRPEASSSTQAMTTQSTTGLKLEMGESYDPALEPEDTLEPEEPTGGWAEPDVAYVTAEDMDGVSAADNGEGDLEGAFQIPESDVDGDGFSDLVSLHSTGTAYVYPGGYDGQFQPTFDSAASSFAGTMNPAQFDGSGHYLIDVEDVNGDFQADLVTLMSSGTACVYLGQDDNTFAPSCIGSFAGTMAPGLLASSGHEPIGVADVTGDGRGDLVSFYAPTGVVVVYPGQSNGVFGQGVQSFSGTMNSARFDGAGHYFLDVSDVTGDGRADLTTMTNPTKLAYVYPGQANGTFGASASSFNGTLDSALNDGAGHEPIGVADVTGDGRSDLVTFYGPMGVVIVYPGQSTGVFGVGVQSFAGTMNSSLFDGVGHELATVIDVDGDGLSDLVTAHTSGVVDVYRANENGTFTGPFENFAGTWNSSRFDQGGHELAMEKPSQRRRGCGSNGCYPSG